MQSTMILLTAGHTERVCPAKYKASEKFTDKEAKYKVSEKFTEKEAKYKSSEKFPEKEAKYKASEKFAEKEAKYKASDKFAEKEAKYINIKRLRNSQRRKRNIKHVRNSQGRKSGTKSKIHGKKKTARRDFRCYHSKRYFQTQVYGNGVGSLYETQSLLGRGKKILVRTVDSDVVVIFVGFFMQYYSTTKLSNCQLTLVYRTVGCALFSKFLRHNPLLVEL